MSPPRENRCRRVPDSVSKTWSIWEPAISNRILTGEPLGLIQITGVPPGATGGMAPITTPLGEMFMFTIEGDLPLAEKRALLDWVIRPQLRTIPGVADVNSLGGEVRTFEVVPNPQSLAARGLALKDLQAVLEANNRNDGAGRLNDGEEALLVRAEGAIRTVDDVKTIVLQARDGKVVDWMEPVTDAQYLAGHAR